MGNFIKKYFPILILVAIVCITHWRWIFLHEIFSSGDTPEFSWFLSTCKDMFTFPSTWAYFSAPGFGGSPNIILSTYLSFSFMYSGLATLFHSTILASKLVFLIPIQIISVIGSFLLVQSMLKSRMAGIIGSIVYSYNVHTLLLQTGTLPWAMTYAFVPLLLFCFIKSIDTKKLSVSLLTGLVGFVAGSYDFRILYIALWVMVFYMLYQVFLAIKNKVYGQIVPILQYGSISFVTIFLLNFFWIFPLYFSDKSQAFGRAIFGSQFLNFSDALAFFHPFWTGNIPSVFHVQPIPLYFWLIPVLAILGLITNFRNKKVLFFACIALLGILLTKQEDNPFPHLYAWLYYHFPGFNAYREANKFFLLIALGYSVLIGAFIDWVWTHWKEKKWQIYGKYMVTFLIACIFLWNAKPLITGEIGKLFIPVTRPNDYTILGNFLSNDHEFSTTLWVPHFSKWSFFDNTHPNWALYGATEWDTMFRKNSAYKTHTYNSPYITPSLYWVLGLLEQTFSNNLLNITNTKYVIVPAQYKNIPDDDMFLGTSINDRQLIINLLDHVSYLKKINIGTKEVVVYENIHYKPLIYTTNEIDSVYKTIPYQSVQYTFINLTEYHIILKNIQRPVYLNFNNSYADGWVLDLGNMRYLSNKDHLQTDMKFNAFYIDPAEIRKAYDKHLFTQNADGSINLTLKLYYKPQDQVIIGSYVSVVSFVIVIGILIFNFFKRQK